MYREWMKMEFPIEYFTYMYLETTWLNGRPRNRLQNKVRKYGRIEGGDERQERVYSTDELKKFLRKSKES
jgi:hypothetical protein